MSPLNAKILIVDDNESMRELVRELLHDLGVTSVDEAPNGRAALTLFQSNHYDLVLTDWHMPFVTGVELLRSIRHGEAGRKTPVLILSSDVSPERTREALNAGANEFVAKPFAPARLCEKVLRFIAPLAQMPDSLIAAH